MPESNTVIPLADGQNVDASEYPNGNVRERDRGNPPVNPQNPSFVENPLAETTYWLTVATDSSSLEFFNNYPGTATVYGSGAGSDTYGTWENPASSPFAEYPASLYFNLTAVPIGGGSKWKKLYEGLFGL